MSGYVIWQPGHVAEDSVTMTADGLGDGRETSGRGGLIISDKSVPFDLQPVSCDLILFMRPDSVPNLGAIQIIYLLTYLTYNICAANVFFQTQNAPYGN